MGANAAGPLPVVAGWAREIAAMPRCRNGSTAERTAPWELAGAVSTLPARGRAGNPTGPARHLRRPAAVLITSPVAANALIAAQASWFFAVSLRARRSHAS